MPPSQLRVFGYQVRVGWHHAKERAMILLSFSIGDLQLHWEKSWHLFIYSFFFDFGLRLEALAGRKTRPGTKTHCFVPRG